MNWKCLLGFMIVLVAQNVQANDTPTPAAEVPYVFVDAEGTTIPIVEGCVLLCRNTDEALNTAPGHWNHLAVYVGNGEVVESQAEQGVIKTKLADFKARKYVWHPLFPLDRELGHRASERAKGLVGRPYFKRSSIRNKIGRRGANCVSVVKEAYKDEKQHDMRRLRKPDDILRFPRLFGVDCDKTTGIGVKGGLLPEQVVVDDEVETAAILPPLMLSCVVR